MTNYSSHMTISGRQEFSREWRKTRLLVLKGLKKLGRDIPITGYTSEDELRKMTEERKRLGIGRW